MLQDIQRRSITCFALTLILALTGWQSVGNADDLIWIGADGGRFSTASNWDPVGPPGPDDNAFFLDNRTINFIGNATSNQLLVRGQDVFFRPVGLPVDAVRNYTVQGTTTILDIGRLTLTGNGDRRMQLTQQGTFMMGMFADDNPNFTVLAGGDFMQTGGSLIVGARGSSSIDIAGGSFTTNNNRVVLGDMIGSVGTIRLSDANSVWNNVNSASASPIGMEIGLAGQGIIDITAGTFISRATNVISTRLGGQETGFGQVTLSGADSVWRHRGVMHIGSQGTGILRILNGARMTQSATSNSDGSVSLGTLAGSTGLLEVSGANSTYDSTTDLIVGFGGNGTLLVGSGGTVSVDTLSIGDRGSVSVVGGTLNFNNVATTHAINFSSGSINHSGGNFGNGEWNVFGNSLDLASNRSFSTTGTLNINGGRSLNLNSGGFHAGSLTINEGTIAGSSVLQLPTMVGDNRLVGRGIVSVNVSGNDSSFIQATGLLSLGNPNSAFGFNYDGTLEVGGQHVILHDQNRAELGILTTLFGGGRLSAHNGFNLRDGDVLNAFGDSTIDGAFTNNGIVNGATTADEFLTFTDDVDGGGIFTGNILFSDAFRPGNSPGVVDFENVSFDMSSFLAIELAGRGHGEFDVLRVSGNAELNGTLDVSLLNGFELEQNEEFLIFDVAGIRNGEFTGLSEGSSIGIFGDQELFISYRAGDGNDIALFTAVPEPSSAFIILACLGLAATRRRSRRS